jgi:hypothetical protein
LPLRPLFVDLVSQRLFLIGKLHCCLGGTLAHALFVIGCGQDAFLSIREPATCGIKQ